mmetsp:Transcript_90023/g.145658  ORF Transcript_90023/g.145658 Transcript_90023/m.145658 type:complete len:81 (+) Transcript_90023:571-813(+)
MARMKGSRRYFENSFISSEDGAAAYAGDIARSGDRGDVPRPRGVPASDSAPGELGKKGSTTVRPFEELVRKSPGFGSGAW